MVTTLIMLRGRACGGPRDNVMIEAGSTWDGIVHKDIRSVSPEALQPYHLGRYRWDVDHWQWHPGRYVRMYGPRGGRNAGNWVWIDDSMSHDEREALLSVHVIPTSALNTHQLVDRTRGVVDMTVNTITATQPRQPRATRTLHPCAGGCGKLAKAWWRRTCGAMECRAQSYRQSMFARRNKPNEQSEVTNAH